MEAKVSRPHQRERESGLWEQRATKQPGLCGHAGGSAGVLI